MAESMISFQWLGLAWWFWLGWLALFIACCLLSWRIR